MTYSSTNQQQKQFIGNSGDHHSFDITNACKYSVEESILIHNFQLWCNYNARLGKNFHDGRTWTYQSLEEIAAHFPYWTKDQVRRYVEKLTAKDILIKGNYNKSVYDKTIWYSFKNEIEFSIWQNRHLLGTREKDPVPKHPDLREQQEEMANLPSREGELATPIPCTNPCAETTTTPTPFPQMEQRGASAPVAVVAFYECLREVGISDEQKQSLTSQFSEASVVKAVMYATHPCTVIKKTLMDCLAWACRHPEKVTIPEDRIPSPPDPKKILEINRKKAHQIKKDYQSKANEMRFKIYEDGHQLFIKFTPIAYDDPRFNEMVERCLKEAKLK